MRALEAVYKSLPGQPAARTCLELLTDYRKRQGAVPASSGLIHFSGVGDQDVYNISAPFQVQGKSVIAGRIEPRDTEHSRIGFFSEQASGQWTLIEGVPDLNGLQDPCITRFDGDLIVGGVRFPIPTAAGHPTWAMEFYRGTSLDTLERFFIGPLAMKDIRLLQLVDGRLGVLTRPQGAKGGRGKIGFCIVESPEALSIDLVESAPLLPEMISRDEWVGANEAHLLPDGRVGVLGHIAYMSPDGHRNYFPMAFELDPTSGRWQKLQIIAERSAFPPGPAKREDLANVVFSGGLVRDGRGSATLYGGLSDAAAGFLSIKDPFWPLN